MLPSTRKPALKPFYQQNQPYRPFYEQQPTQDFFGNGNESDQTSYRTSTRQTLIEDEPEPQAHQRKKSSQHISFFDGLFCCFTYTVGSLLPKPKNTINDQ